MKFFFLIIFLASCSKIQYKSKNALPVSFDHNPKHRKYVEVKGTREYFLAGFFPNYHEVFVDEVIYEAGHKELSKLSIEDNISVLNIVLSVATLGFYTPRDFVIKGFTIED